MRTKSLFFFVTLFASTRVASAQSLPPTIAPQPVSEEYCGVSVTDPYRNLEDLEDPTVQAWMKAQADYARQILDAIPGRQALIEQMEALDGGQSPMVRQLQITNNDRYFYLKTRPEDQQPKLYYRDGYKGKEVLLFDPEVYEKGEQYTIDSYVPSLDGSKVALSVSEKGTEVGEARILQVATRKLYPERLARSRWISSWLPDHKRFTYTPFGHTDVKRMEARQNRAAMIHVVGTPQSEDKPVFSAQQYPGMGIRPEHTPYVDYNENTQLIYGTLSTADNHLHIYYAPASELTKPKISWKPLFTPGQGAITITGSFNDINFVANAQYYYFSSVKSGKQRILRMPVSNPDVEKAEVLIPEGEGVIDFLNVTKEGLYFVRTKNGVSATLHFIVNGSKTVQDIPLPQPAGMLVLNSKDAASSDLWVILTGWTQDRISYRYDAATHQFLPDPLYTEKPVPHPEFDDLVVEEITVSSHDGVAVPLSLVYRKGTPRNGSAPVLMEGYGAYSITMNPMFWPTALLWAQRGGVYACAHVRGGGELGEPWHLAGMKTAKPNTWKDLIACAEYLVNNHYTSSKKIAISGGSAGGILIGRAMTERPDLFAAALPAVGVMNTLRMENTPNGPGNAPEFGTVKDSTECRALIEMDAYLHLKPDTPYPATLITAGFNDPRVIAWQPAKFAARLQASTTSGKPVLFFTDYEAGHGMGNAKQKRFESLADELSFGLWQTGHPDFQPLVINARDVSTY